MRAAGSLALRRAAVWALLATLFIVFLSLAAWQVQRRSWKLALIERVEQRAHGQPQPLSPPASWPNLTAAQAEYQPVAVSGTWLPQHTILSQAVTELGAGFWVMTPLQQADGSRVWINRGFVPDHQRAAWLGGGAPSTDGPPVHVQGLWRANEPDGGFLRHNDPAAGRWYSRDVIAMAQAQKLANASPFFIDAGLPGEARDAADSTAWPRPGLTVIRFHNSHLVYVLTWLALAALTAVAAVLVRRHEKAAHLGGTDAPG
ncbi:SURF1 family protein [Ottowia oryzae]